VKHLDDGALRRLVDDPEPEAGEHLATCAECRARYDAVTADATRGAALLATGSVLVDAEAALRRLNRRLAVEVPPKPRPWARLVPDGFALPRRAARPLAIAALVAVGVTTLFVTGAAESMIAIFQPQQVTAITVNPESLATLPDLNLYGRVDRSDQPQVKRALGWSDSANQTGLSFLEPGQLPASVSGTPIYYYLTQGRASFTFDQQTAAQTAAARHESLPSLPANIDGSTLYVNAGPGGVEVIGGAPRAATSDGAGASMLSEIPQLVIAEVKAPSVTSTGPSVKDFETALLSMPGVSPDLAAQIRAIGDPSTTLPIPIPTSMASSQTTNVGGAPAVLIGDNTGLGSAVVWVKNGMVYAVGGALSQGDVLSIARSLH